MISDRRETLAQRLERGPLSGREATKLCRSLLTILAAEHARGLAHGDITPHAIVLEHGRPVLAGFRTASLNDAAADLSALAGVMYEAVSGRQWTAGMKPAADWSGIPRRLRYALRKALAADPRDRFPDAAAFQRALWVPRPQPLVWPAVVVLAFAAVLIGILSFCRPLGLCPERSFELMIVPFSVEGDSASGLGIELASLVAHRLQLFREFAVVPGSVAFKFWQDSLGGRPPHRLRVATQAIGSIVSRDSALVVNVEVRDSLGRPLQRAIVRGRLNAETALADSIVLRLLQWFHPELVPLTRTRRGALGPVFRRACATGRGEANLFAA
jgi:hypothetical protein